VDISPSDTLKAKVFFHQNRIWENIRLQGWKGDVDTKLLLTYYVTPLYIASGSWWLTASRMGCHDPALSQIWRCKKV
jgi:hypothetical protein